MSDLSSEHGTRYLREMTQLVGARIRGVRRMTSDELARFHWSPPDDVPIVFVVSKDGCEFLIVPANDAVGKKCGWLYVCPSSTPSHTDRPMVTRSESLLDV